jgi:glycosyltransferase involved in cell wall biosynthesis
MNITAIIIAKNEELMIANCIEALRWCKEIVVIDNGSNDGTAKLAEALGARVIGFGSADFSKVRNEGLHRSKTDWVFYVDADERVSPELAKEILVNIETETGDVFKMKRENICYGYKLSHGGWDKDFVTRVFKKSALEGWQGAIHESPIFKGKVVELKNHLVHLTHRSTASNLRKSAEWTGIEAELLYKAGISQVTLFTFFRKGIMEFVRRAFLKGGQRDGMVGFVEALVQGMNKIMVYIQVWEMQQKPNLPDRYAKVEKDLGNSWKKELPSMLAEIKK